MKRNCSVTGEAPYVKLLEGGRGTTTITTDIEEEEAWPGRH